MVVAGGAGGWVGSWNTAESSTKIYTVEDDTWRTGTPLPTKMKEFVTLPYGDSFLFLGGHDGSSCLNSIYQVHLFTTIWSDRAPLHFGPRSPVRNSSAHSACGQKVALLPPASLPTPPYFSLFPLSTPRHPVPIHICLKNLCRNF